MTRKNDLTLFAAITGVIAFLPLNATAQTPTHDEVPFAIVPLDAGGSQTLTMDIYLPPGSSTPRPLVTWIHGGGWSGGSHNAIPPATSQFLSRGIAVASIEYRLSGVAIFPAQIHDVKGAVRFLRANAGTYNLDPSRFASFGSSAGGHLSALLASSAGVAAAEGASGGNNAFSSRVQACVDWFGPTNILVMNLDVTTPPGSTIDHDAPNSPESRLIGFSATGQGIGILRANQNNPAPPFPQKMSLVTLANPVVHASADDPPYLIVHGTADTLVPIKQSQRLHYELQNFAHDVTLTPVQGAGHGGFPAAVLTETVDWIAARLATPFFPTGDLNCDGTLNPFDIGPFLLALSDAEDYAGQFPDCNLDNADINGNGTVNAFDIQEFLDLL